MNRKRAILAGLLLLLLLSVGYSIYSSPRQERISLEKSPRVDSRVAPTERKAQTSVGEGSLRVDLLKPQIHSYRGVSRDLFYGNEPTVAKLRPTPAVIAPPPVVIVPPPPIVIVPPPPIISAETRMELGRFVFLGYLEKTGIKTIFLGSGEDVFVVKKGERFGKEREFLIVELNPNQMTVQERDNPRFIALPLVEKESLKPPTEEALRGNVGILQKELSPSETTEGEQSAEAPELPPLEEPSPQEGALMQTEGQTNGSDEE